VFSSALVDLAHSVYPWSWAGLVLVWAPFPLVLGPKLLGSGPSPVGLMSGVYNVAFLVYFWLLFYVIPTCPPANE
jgi:hypothetical protein